MIAKPLFQRKFSAFVTVSSLVCLNALASGGVGDGGGGGEFEHGHQFSCSGTKSDGSFVAVSSLSTMPSLIRPDVDFVVAWQVGADYRHDSFRVPQGSLEREGDIFKLSY